MNTRCSLLAITMAFLIASSAFAQSNRPFGSTNIDQSAFALGTMSWNVILVQDSTAPIESWNASEISNVQSKIQDAANYWEGLTSGFHSAAQLDITVNFANSGSPIGVSTEPTANRSESWVNDAMSTLGYNLSNRFSNVRNYNNDVRDAQGTHWAATIFVMDNTSVGQDSYAYAYHGGPFTILTYDPAGWTPANFNMVVSHEFGHIFMAHDEYAASGRRTTDRGGYLNVTNDNASLDGDGNPVTPPQPNALMRNNGNFGTHIEYDPSPSSSAMFGHLDTDGDSIPDILDTKPILTGNDAGSNVATGEFVFSGNSVVNPIDNNNPLNVGFSNSQNAMTINTIENAFYRINGGVWTAFAAADGSYGDYSENLSLMLSGLSGNNTIDIYSINSVGNVSDILSFAFNTAAVPEPAGALVILGSVGLLYFRRRRRRADNHLAL